VLRIGGFKISNMGIIKDYKAVDIGMELQIFGHFLTSRFPGDLRDFSGNILI
jgi:hypothetical protein